MAADRFRAREILGVLEATGRPRDKVIASELRTLADEIREL